MIFDNASDWLVVEGSNCATCPGDTYDTSQSDEAKQVNFDFSERQFGTIRMTGNEWTDTVCLTSEACVKDFEYFLINELVDEGLKEPIDGVLGLARNEPYYLADVGEVLRGPSVLKALDNAGIIEEDTFSFHFDSNSNEAQIDFGAPVSERMSDPADLTYINLLSDFYWSQFCDGFAFNTPDNGWQWGSVRDAEKTVGEGSVYSFFDTAAASIIIPTVYFEQYLEQMFSTMADDEYEIAAGYVVTKCYEDFPTLFFLFDGKWIQVEPKEYVYDISDNQDGSLCVLLISEADWPFLVMGMPVYMDYYTVHDATNGRLGFVPSVNSSKSPLESGVQPERIFESSDPAPPEEYSWISILICVCLSMCFCTIWCSATGDKYNEDRDGDGDRNDRDDDKDDDDRGKNYGLLICIDCFCVSVFTLVVFVYLLPIIDQYIRATFPNLLSHESEDLIQSAAALQGNGSFVLFCTAIAYLGYKMSPRREKKQKRSSKKKAPRYAEYLTSKTQ